MTERIRVPLLADDHNVVRAGLHAVLATEPDLAVVGECATAEEAVRLAAAGDVDVVLMDLQFGDGMDGATATAAITAAADAPRVLVLTTYDADADILAAVPSGRQRLPPQGRRPRRPHPCHQGRCQWAAGAGAIGCQPPDGPDAQSRKRAQPKIEVLQLVADGLSNATISKRIHLSQATVKSHLVHIYTKLNVDSRTAAVAAAHQQGLIRRSRPRLEG